MNANAYRFEETREQRGARLRVRAFHFARYREAEPVRGTGPGALDPQPLPVTPSPSSKQPRYGPRVGRPPGRMLTRTEANAKYRAKQREKPCKKCGAPGWAAGLCSRCYKIDERARKRTVMGKQGNRATA